MHRVRYYSRLIEPAHFKQGVRGWWIRLLNRLRFWIETRVCYHVVRYLAAEDGKTKTETREFVAAFRQDAREESEKLSQTPPLPGPRSMMDEDLMVTQVMPRAELRMRDRRETSNMIARMTAPPRQRRYTQSKHRIGDPDGDFEPLQGEDDVRITDQEEALPPTNDAGTVPDFVVTKARNH